MDWLGDVGGLRDALFLIGTFILFLNGKIRGDILDAFLLQNFFVREDKEAFEGLLEETTLKNTIQRKESNLEKRSGFKSQLEEQEQIRAIANRKPFRMRYQFCDCLRSKKEKRILERGLDKTM